jgi:hypothetical protein
MSALEHVHHDRQAVRLCPSPLAERLVEAFVHAAAVEAPEGLLLIGSAGRGEAVSVRRDGSETMLSDLEFLAVVQTRERAEHLREIARQVARLHQSEAFHVDVTALLPSQLRRSRPRFWLWESAAGGRLVAGHDFRPLLPSVTAANLEHRELNDVLLWQYRRLLAAVEPTSLDPAHTCADGACETVRDAAVRAVLDVPTWYLAANGALHVGFANRARAFGARSEVPAWVRDVTRHALDARTLGDDATCRWWVERAIAVLEWADDRRRELPRVRRGLSDVGMRSRLSDARTIVRYRRVESLRRPTTLLAPRYQLLARCRLLANELRQALTDGTPVPERWVDERDAAFDDASRGIAWLVEAAACG